MAGGHAASSQFNNTATDLFTQVPTVPNDAKSPLPGKKLKIKIKRNIPKTNCLTSQPQDEPFDSAIDNEAMSKSFAARGVNHVYFNS